MAPANVAAEPHARQTRDARPADSTRPLRKLAAAARLTLGAIFLWAFLDKTFGLGYSTPAARSWLAGGSPTRGFLANTKGWAAPFFQSIAGHPVTDALFMLGLFAIGVALLLGIGMRIAGWSGAALMGLMWLAAVPGVPGTTNPLVDDHIVFALVLAAMAMYPVVGQTLGLGAAWQRRIGKARWLE